MSRSHEDSSRDGSLTRVHSREPLTRREQQILALVAAGERTRSISQQLGISQNTIKSHLTAIYRKTGSRSRVEAARHYLETSAAPSSTESHSIPAAIPPASRAPTDHSKSALLQRQIEEIEARIQQLAPAVTEAERLHEALTALRRIEESQ